MENLIGYARRNVLVPVPAVADLPALNVQLREACLADQQRTMAGRPTPIVDLLAEERAALVPLPERPLAIGELREVVVRPTGRVCFETNEYSVPTRYVGQRLTLQADPFQVRIAAGEAVVMEHACCDGRHQGREDVRHAVPALLEKPFAIPFPSAL